MRVAMAQINPTVGDLEGNARKIRDYIEEAKRRQCDLVVFPELAITGYPPQDLLHEKAFVRKNKEVLKRIIEANAEIAAITGFVDYDDQGNLSNGAAVLQGKRLIGVARKTLLPTFDVFDEDRYFEPARRMDVKPVALEITGRRLKIGVEICEDLWDERYDIKVTDLLVQRGADLIVNISSSPLYVGKRFERMSLLKKKARKNKVPIFYINLVGGQDELVFDGQSLAVDASGKLIAMAKQFEEDLVITDIDLQKRRGKRINPPPYNREEEMFNALVLGIRDYFSKTGFKKAILGMSGGIDSSLVACLAVAALGPENVIGLSMPSKFSSEHGQRDARRLAENLGLCLIQFPIQAVVNSYKSTLSGPLEKIRDHFGVGMELDDPVADENIQPRVRGNCLMDFSNRLRDLKILVLNTGNKTELALGYCTLYGDMTGGLGALGDVSKLEVYKLAEYVNEKSGREIIPGEVLAKMPSPELSEGQVDPFDFSIVSPLVDEIIENRRSKQELVRIGYPSEIVEDTYRRIRRAEYKRWQAAPCIKITRKAFGIGWKMPIVNKYDG
ncbi:MAG: NAD+ synthase [Acidobacteriota bacterium]